jgi:hypothetical protein
MSATSILDEIADIEKSACGGFLLPGTNNAPSNNKSTRSNQVTLPMNRVGTQNSRDHEKGCSLDGFPGQSNGSGISSLSLSGKTKQRKSISVNPMAMRGAMADLADLVDSDDEDEKKSPRREKALPPPHVSNPKASGGPEHRPLVGGFAAAAYEAARVDHYKKMGKEVRGHNPPRLASYYPRYP